MYTFLEEILSKEIFKINAGCSSQRPLIFNITNEEEFLKMVNSVFSGTEEELSIFSDFFTLRKSEAINEDEEECEEEFDGQLSDGVFENSRVGWFEEI